MKFSLNTIAVEKSQKTCIFVGIFEDGQLTESASKLDKLSKGFISQLVKDGQLQGKLAYTLTLYNLANTTNTQVVLVGCGKKGGVNAGNFRKIIASSVRSVSGTKTTKVLSYLSELEVENHDLAWKIQQMVEVSSEAVYQFTQFKSHKEPQYLNEVLIHIPANKLNNHTKQALTRGVAIAEAVEYTKNIANLPSNICTPTYLATEAKKLAKSAKLKLNVLEEADMKKLGMGALLAVAQGSREKPKLITLQYQGTNKKQAPTVLVGKGITFDTGGVSLKPADGMVGMKYDMCGAATVLGVLKAATTLKLPVNIVGVLAAAENMPSGSAYKPEDIVTSMSGQTIEVLNTDAEGRLVLCDALTYCERFNPDVVIDIATLTGAVVVALGTHASGLLSNQPALAQALLNAGEKSFDRAWQMPLWEEYQEQLKSPFADMSNVGGRFAGVITAACFLSRFTKKYNWAHLDVAGTAAMMTGADRKASGRPVPLLMQYLIDKAH